jgi:hypothetical protein
MQDKIIMLVIVIIIGFAGGWFVNGWRLDSKIQKLKAFETDNMILHDALNVQNARILELEHDSEHKKKLAEKAVRIATEANKKLEGQLILLRNATGTTCEEANDLINQVIQ